MGLYSLERNLSEQFHFEDLSWKKLIQLKLLKQFPVGIPIQGHLKKSGKINSLIQ